MDGDGGRRAGARDKRSGRWTASRRSVTRWCRRRRGRAFRPEAPLTRVVAADYLVGLLAGRGEMERNTDRDVSNKNKHTSIADNPSAKKVSDYLLLARIVRLTTGFSKTLGITNATVDRLHHSAAKALRQSDILTLPDRFNAAFASEGWIATGSMSADTIRKAVKLYESGKKQEAQDEILAWFQEDTINLLAIKRGKRFNKAATRWHQLREALQLTLEERYWSAVPLILVACDGFASDVLGTSPFTKDADLTAFDSIAGHPNSLPFLIKKLTKDSGRYKVDNCTQAQPVFYGFAGLPTN